MKDKPAKLTLQVRNYFSALGRKGGKAGRAEDKRRAALVRWGKRSALADTVKPR